MTNKSLFTKAVHAGDDHTQHFGALSVPIYTASVFGFSDADEAASIHNEEKDGYYYGRLGNPTQRALERAVSELENCEAALALASGMAAVSAAVFTLVKTGDHIVAPESGYSTTTNFLKYIGERFGIETTFVDAANAENYVAAIRPNTKLFWIETPSNPIVRVTDIKAVSAIAKEHSILTVVDNTFATPFNQSPCELGADAVIHSATKYLGGHSDLTAGVLTGKREIVEAARQGANKFYGGNIAPQVAWLVLRGIKTLALRMRQHNDNAYAIANMLASHPKVIAVHYPGLPSHQNHKVAVRQMHGGFGGMIGLDVGTVEAGKTFANSVRLCTLATSLGGVETILQHSASMTHSTFSREERLKAGISDGLIRLSVGIEDVNDLISDIERALDKI
ncbi:MAG TPA: PLP-dependent aspartate aminotransferase family protein [Pyrinomonadaceae bacterium]|nr:PLP-dependent transferase [Acidobacteriota bacterium]HQZ96599.1 PLP-dependent aspartate aminotransferase family protein [Pyrinomonadaceae bacterium]